MKLSRLISKLKQIYTEEGDCEVELGIGDQDWEVLRSAIIFADSSGYAKFITLSNERTEPNTTYLNTQIDLTE